MPSKGYKPKFGSTRTVPTLFLAFLLVLVPVFGAIGFGAVEAGGNTNGQLVQTTGGNISLNAQQAFGWDPVTNTYIPATLTVGHNNVTISFPSGDKISWIWVFTANPKFNDKAILQNSSIYSYVNVKITSTSRSNLSNVNMYMGHAVNASVSTSTGDKGVSNFLMDMTFYSSTVNNLGNALELPVLQLLGGSFSSTGIYYIGLSTAGNFNATSGGSAVSVTLTQYFGHTATYNILAGTEAIMVLVGIAELVLAYIAIPRHKEWSE